MAKQQKSLQPKITIIPGRGVSQTINYLLEDRDELEWIIAVGRTKNGELFFYDTGGDIVEDLGTLEYLKARIVRAHFGDEYEDALRAEKDDPLPDAPPVAPPSIRFYTSGTTGRPKAVERARSSVENYLAAAREHLGIFHVEQPSEVHLCCGPLYHSAPLGFSDYALLHGQTVVLMERFDAEEFLRLIERERARDFSRGVLRGDGERREAAPTLICAG